MTSGTRAEIDGTNRSMGFTLVEVIVATAVIGIIILIATPSVRNWRPTLDAKQTATTMVNILREARSKAVATNFQHKVDFDLPGRQYRMQMGARAYNTPVSGWTDLTGYGWTKISSGVTLTSGADCNSTNTVDVQFNANGTASLETPWTTASPAPVTVCVQGGAGDKTYRIIMSSAGLISLR